jgi:hypothetical protein
MSRMNQQELCNTAWALGVLGQLDKDTWQEFCDCVVNMQGAACCAGLRLSPTTSTCSDTSAVWLSSSSSAGSRERGSEGTVRLFAVFTCWLCFHVLAL